MAFVIYFNKFYFFVFQMTRCLALQGQTSISVLYLKRVFLSHFEVEQVFNRILNRVAARNILKKN